MATTVSTFYPTSTEVFGTTSPATGAAPTTNADGLPTAGLSQVTVIVSVAVGVTLSGAGSLQAYEYNPLLGRWARVPSSDIALTAAASGSRDLEAGVLLTAPFITAQRDSTRVQMVPSGVTFSAGSAGVTVSLVGSKAVIASNGTGA